MKRLKKSYVLVGVLAILAIVVISIPGLITVKKISCESQFGPCRKEVEEALDKYRSTSLRKAKKQITILLSTEVFIESFDVRFALPSNLKVFIIEKKPIYALMDLEKQAIALTDKEGYIVAIVDKTNLPILSGRNLIGGVGETLQGETLFGLEVLSDMFQFYQVKAGALEKSGLAVELDGGPKVIFPLEGDRAVLNSSLRLIIAKLEQEEEGKSKKATIDLRFKNPVVTYQ